MKRLLYLEKITRKTVFGGRKLNQLKRKKHYHTTTKSGGRGVGVKATKFFLSWEACKQALQIEGSKREMF